MKNIRKVFSKKVTILLAVFVFAGASSAFASAGLGLQSGYVSGVHQSGSADITFRTSYLPFAFGFNTRITDWQMKALGLSIDWWIPSIGDENGLHFYYGPGFIFAFNFNNRVSYDMAARFFIGLDLKIGFLELYVQGTAEAGVTLNGNSDDLFSPVWYFPVQLGFRIWD